MVEIVRDSTSSLEYYESARDLTSRAKRKGLLTIYNQNFKGNEKVLEVGSGLGYLRRNLPEAFNGKWIQLDSQLAFLEEAKRRFQEDSYVGGSAYELPFPNNSLDAVCGYNSFNVLTDLETAIREVRRVLKPRGLFLDIVDLGPSKEDMGSHPNISHGKSDILEFNKHYYDRLFKALSLYFDPEKIEHKIAASWFVGERTEQQRLYDAFVFVRLPATTLIYPHFTGHGSENVGIPPIPKGFKYHERIYRIIGRISPTVARLIEPPCFEISYIEYMQAINPEPTP